MFSFFFIAVTVPILPLSSRCCRRRRLVSAAVVSVHVCRSIWRTLINLVQRIFPSSSLWTTAAQLPVRLGSPSRRCGNHSCPGLCRRNLHLQSEGHQRSYAPQRYKALSRHSPKSAPAYAIRGASFISILRMIGEFLTNRRIFAAFGDFRREGAPAVGLSTAQVARCIFTSFWCWTLNCILKSCN